MAYIDVINIDVTANVRGDFEGKVVSIAGVAAEIHRVLVIIIGRYDVFSHLHKGGGISRVAHDTHLQCADKTFAVRGSG